MSDIASASARAIGLIGANEKRGGASLTQPVKRAMARVTYLSVRGGGLRRQPWVKRPMFLPDNDREWVTLLSSRKSNEDDTKAMASKWFYENYTVLTTNAANLECLATSFAYLEGVRASEPEDAETLEWQTALWELGQAEYSADIGQAPVGRLEIRRWATAKCVDGHPVPEWIRQDKAEPEVFFGSPEQPAPAVANPYSDGDAGGDFSLSGAFGAAIRGDQ